MADDSSPAIIESFTPNMQTVFDTAQKIIAFEDVQNNITGQKLDILRNHYLGEARDNQFDNDYIERSICIQNLIVVNRYITSTVSGYKNRKVFKSFNDYYDTLAAELKNMFPSKVKKTIIVNKEAVFQKLAS